MRKLTGTSLLSSMAHSLSFSGSQSHAHISSSCICSADSDFKALINFEAGLAERLCSLRAGTTSANLNWLIDALAVANSTQSSLRSIIPQLKSHNKPQLQQSLDSTVALLDVCNALKDAMAEIQDYLARLQKTVKPLSEAASATSHSYKRLQICLARMEAGNMKRWQNRVEEACISMKLLKKQMPKLSTTGEYSAVDGATLTTALILAFMTSSFATSAVPNKNPARWNIPVGKCIFSTSVNASTSSCWPGPLRNLQRQLGHAGNVAISEELESLHVAARDIQVDVAAGAAAAMALLKKAEDMEASVEELRLKLASLFQSLASARVESLAC